MNQVFYVDMEGRGFGTQNPDEPTGTGYSFFRDPETRKIMLWVECALPGKEAVGHVHRVRKSLLKKHLWGRNP